MAKRGADKAVGFVSAKGPAKQPRVVKGELLACADDLKTGSGGGISKQSKGRHMLGTSFQSNAAMNSQGASGISISTSQRGPGTSHGHGRQPVQYKHRSLQANVDSADGDRTVKAAVGRLRPSSHIISRDRVDWARMMSMRALPYSRMAGRPAWDGSPMRSRPSALRGLRPVTREPWLADEDIYHKALERRDMGVPDRYTDQTARKASQAHKAEGYLFRLEEAMASRKPE